MGLNRKGDSREEPAEENTEQLLIAPEPTPHEKMWALLYAEHQAAADKGLQILLGHISAERWPHAEQVSLQLFSTIGTLRAMDAVEANVTGKLRHYHVGY